MLIESMGIRKSYIITVMGYDRFYLNENRYSLALNYDILLEFDALKNWVKSGTEWIKDNVKGGVDKIKDMAYDAVDAVKDYGANLKGVVTGLTAMIQDEDEFVKYQKGILSSVQVFPKRLNSKINNIATWLESKSMPTFAKTLHAIKNGVMELWDSIKSNVSWKGALSMMAFGLGTIYLDEEFEILDRLNKTQETIENPKKSLKGKLLDFFSGEIEEATDEIREQLMEWLEEKLGFLKKVKEFIREKILNVVGKALEQFAGPIAWIKQLMDFFKQSDWVLSNLAKMLQKFSIGGSNE